MNIDFFKTLLDVVNYKSITKAAKENNISQSALSQQIHLFEEQFNTKLFDRTHKGVELTDSGHIVTKYATEIVFMHESMKDEILKNENKKLVLHMIATPTICSYALPCTLYHIKNKFPKYNIEIETMTSYVVEKNIEHGNGDIGIIAGKPQSDELIFKKVFKDQYYLVANFEMKIANEISVDLLYKLPMLMLSNSQKTKKIMYDYFDENNIDSDKFNILYELDSIESIKNSVLQNYGVSFLPYSAIKKEIYNKQLKIITLDCFNFHCDYYAIKRRKDFINSKHAKIISYIEKMIIETVC